MKHLDLFSGIGGFALACRMAGGIETVGFVEIDPFCRAVLEKHWPGVWTHDDIKTLDPEALPEADLWTAGFPCQDISAAGRGAGLHGSRSGLFFEIVRLLRGVRRRPAWLLLENVPALRTRGYDRVADELERLGYAVAPVVVGAWAVGAPHKRDRVWIVGRQPQPRRGAEGGVAAGGAGEGVADTEGRGLGTDGGARDTRHADERSPAVADAAEHGCRPGSGEPRDESGAGCGRGELAGGVQLADGNGAGSQEHSGESGDARPKREALVGSSWPSRPGEAQHPWEAPRLAQFPMGGAVDGLPVRLARFANRNALKACGNSIVPQVAAAVIRAMVKERE